MQHQRAKAPLAVSGAGAPHSYSNPTFQAEEGGVGSRGGSGSSKYIRNGRGGA